MHYDISVCFCQNAAVLEMVTLGSSHVLLSLALVGLEIYTLIAGNSAEAPLLQVSFFNLPTFVCVYVDLFFHYFFHDEIGAVYTRHFESWVSMVRAMRKRIWLRRANRRYQRDTDRTRQVRRLCNFFPRYHWLTRFICSRFICMNRMKDTAHEVSLYLPSPRSMLTGSVLNCEVKQVSSIRV